MKKTPPQQLHEPVLLEDTLSILAPTKGETYLDLTAGYGGHASRIIQRIGDASQATLVDRDSRAIAHLQDFANAGASLMHTDFLSAVKQLKQEGKSFDLILIDLGVSSPQLDIADRGFSFTHPGPLDMRMDNRQEQTAADIVNNMPVAQLESIIRRYGEEPHAKKIAKAIIEARPIATTNELADVIKQSIRGKWGKIHPATRTFQAIRIALNNELELVEQTLPLLPGLLSPGGRLAVISFHSLEDRLVKRFLSEQDRAGYEAELQIITKRPISGALNDVHNPRARSAKLRAAVKIKTK